MQGNKLIITTFASLLCLFLFFIQMSAATWPSQVVNITSWKLTLPIGEIGDPIEIYQPTLNQYILNPYFGVGPNKTSIRFRVVITNETVTTSGSNYPRSELREMDSVNPSSVKASWNTSVGVHTMIIDQTITKLPAIRNKLIAGQIHDADEFIVTINLEGTKLYINVQDVGTTTITKNYILGTRFQIKIQAKNGTTSIYYNDMNTPVYSVSKTYKGAYFKAGCYSQSNCAYEGTSCGKSSNYAEVLIHNLTVTHEYPKSGRKGMKWFGETNDVSAVRFGLVNLVIVCLVFAFMALF